MLCSLRTQRLWEWWDISSTPSLPPPPSPAHLPCLPPSLPSTIFLFLLPPPPLPPFPGLPLIPPALLSFFLLLPPPLNSPLDPLLILPPLSPPISLYLAFFKLCFPFHSIYLLCLPLSFLVTSSPLPPPSPLDFLLAPRRRILCWCLYGTQCGCCSSCKLLFLRMMKSNMCG